MSPKLGSVLLLLLGCSLCLGSLRADTFKFENPGTGTIAIGGKWEFHAGDDLGWANPAFDDSAWEQLSADKTWGDQTHPSYAGFAWYRKRIRSGGRKDHADSSGVPLAILIPPVDDAYELYWNGRYVGGYGRLPPHARWTVNGYDGVFALGSLDGPGVLAIRVWKCPLSALDPGTLGGLNGPPVLGYEPVLQQQAALVRYRHEQQNLPRFLIAAVVMIAGVLSLVLFLRQRSQWLYLVLAVYLFDDGFGSFLQLNSLYYGLNYYQYQVIESIYYSLQDISLWVVLLILFGLSNVRSWRRWTAILAGLYLAAEAADNALLFRWQYLTVRGQWIDGISAAVYELTTLYIFFIAAFGLARKRETALLPLATAAFTFGVWNFVSNVSAEGVRFTHWTLSQRLQTWGLQAGGYTFDARFLLDTFLFAILLLTVSRQQVLEGRRQAEIESELRSAREVQQSLIQEEAPIVAGFRISSVYKPAWEVGGDFFQVLPLGNSIHGTGTLVILGDVSGKGMKAAMTVSMIVGTVRTLAEYTQDPVAILRGLNERLLHRQSHLPVARAAGRVSGFVTCLMLHLEANGNATLFNAGHLSPYRDGVELPVAGSLPLGLVNDAEPSELAFRLQEGETLAMFTDGVLEARNAKREIYGFERVEKMMATRPSAQQVADAACAFGQEDDITVLSITRVSAAIPSVPDPTLHSA